MPLLHRPVTPGVAIRIPSGCGLTAVLPASADVSTFRVGATINRPRPSSEPEGLIAGDQLDVDARVPEEMAAARVEHVLAAEDGAPLAAADEDAARDGR